MIGGNILGTIQVKSVQKDSIGCHALSWTDFKTIKGYLDMITDEARYTNFQSKISESTHVFVADYVDLSSVKVSDSHMVIGNETYDIVMIDNPMNLNRQIEILLKKVG